MFNEQRYDEELKRIHEQVTMPLDQASKESYELFSKFMNLYETEKRLQHWAFTKCFETEEEETERTLDDLQ